MKKKELMVTIRCLVYNHEPYIRQCLDGFVMQKTNFKFEAIVHDDASTDGSAAIIREYAAKHPNIIKPLFETENQYSKKDGSLIQIMNAHTFGKYVAICEGDDYWIDPYKLQKQVDALEANPQCSISFCKVQCVSVNNDILECTIPYKEHIKEGIVTLADYTKEEYRIGRWTFHTSSYLYRSNLIPGYEKIIKNEFKEFPYGDMPTLLYCLINGDGYYISDIGSCYRMFSGGYNSKVQANVDFKINQEKKLIKALKDFNNYTKKKYTKDINARVMRAYFMIDYTIYGRFAYCKIRNWPFLLKRIKSFFNKNEEK